jgi:hypothetical protein
METILYAPMLARSQQDAFGIGGQTGNIETGFDGFFPVHDAPSDDHHQTVQTRPRVRITHTGEVLRVRSRPAFTHINATMPFLTSLA